MGSFYIGVDVGTASVRAAIVSEKGKIIARHVVEIKVYSESNSDYFAQSSNDIWKAVCSCIKNVMKVAAVHKDHIKGIGFDATCSLVVLDPQGRPLSISGGKTDTEEVHNIIMWMDHRAKSQTQRINATNDDLLKYVGGKLSIEMQLPKMLWLKENLFEECWSKAGYFMDLPEFLTWTSTGCFVRSSCDVVAKWLYSYDSKGLSEWPLSLFSKIGLTDLTHRDFATIGSLVKNPGEPCGDGLLPEVAEELNLNANTPVAVPIIDAHAGYLGTAASVQNVIKDKIDLSETLVMICGTSTCHISINENPVFIPGVYGPSYSIIIPGWYVNEAGQTAAGKLIDHIISSHPASPEARRLSTEKWGYEDIPSYLHGVLCNMRDERGLSSVSYLTNKLHMWPDYHGNRSPLSDDSLTGMISGLSLSCGIEDLALIYLATVQALAYSTRHIIDTMVAHGCVYRAIAMCGGLSNNQLYVQTHADITGLKVVLPSETDTVVLGAAMLAAHSSGRYRTLSDAMMEMSSGGEIIFTDSRDSSYHEKKYKVFLKMLEHQKIYSDIMDS